MAIDEFCSKYDFSISYANIIFLFSYEYILFLFIFCFPTWNTYCALQPLFCVKLHDLKNVKKMSKTGPKCPKQTQSDKKCTWSKLFKTADFFLPNLFLFSVKGVSFYGRGQGVAKKWNNVPSFSFFCQVTVPLTPSHDIKRNFFENSPSP